MEVLNMETVANSGGGQVRLIASFDLRVSPDMKMYGLKLMETRDGRRIIYAPNANGGRRTATFSPAMAAAITEAAIQQLKGHITANEQQRRSA